LNATLPECGRCGAPNPEDADFCQRCGALLAAYRAPSGATETTSVESTSPRIEYPANTSLLAPTLGSLAAYESPTSPIATVIPALDEVTESIPRLTTATGLLPNELTAEPALPNPQPTESAWHVAASITRETPKSQPVDARPSTTAHVSSTKQLSDPLPIPDQYGALSGRNFPNPRNVLPSTRRSIGGKPSSTPQLLIFAGITAFLLAFFIGLSAGSTMSVVLLFLGGPLGFGLIMAGVLMLIGKHPTGRP
jgi:hypothetical protein